MKRYYICDIGLFFKIRFLVEERIEDKYYTQTAELTDIGIVASL